MPFHSTKAVANGALAWYLGGNIASRVNKYHYGIEADSAYDHQNAAMRGRRTYTGYDGTIRVAGGWSCIVAKVCQEDCYADGSTKELTRIRTSKSTKAKNTSNNTSSHALRTALIMSTSPFTVTGGRPHQPLSEIMVRIEHRPCTCP
jgi:hypothetical protein